MRINEVIVSDPIELEEGFTDTLAKGVGGVAQGIGAVAGGAAGAWDRMKQGYAKGKAAVAGTPQVDATTTSTSTSVQPNDTVPPAGQSATGVQPAAPAQARTNPAPQATPDELDDLKNIIGKLNPDQKQDIAAQLTKPEIQQPSSPGAQQASPAGTNPSPAAQQASPAGTNPSPAAPTGTSVDIGQVKKQSAQQAQAAQADKQTAQQQIAATQAANAEKAKQDAAVKAAKDAAMAKPGFQQTAADKLAIQKAQQMGIREAVKESKQPKKPAPKQPAKKPTPGKKKKVVVEFNSKFLGRKI